MFGEASRNEWENAGKKREEEEEEDSEEEEDQDEGVLPEIENEIRNRMKKGDDDKKTTTASSTTKETTSETSTSMSTSSSSTPTPIVRISTTVLPSTVLVLDPRNKSYLFHSPHPEELKRARASEKRKKKRRNEGPNKARMNWEEEEVVDDITEKR